MSPQKSISTPRGRSNSTSSSRANPHQNHPHTMSHPVLDNKDRRSYEHSRQKHLHPSDRMTSRSNNQWKRHVGNSCKSYLAGPALSAKWLPSLTRDDLGMDTDLDYVGPYEDDGRWDDDVAQTAHVLPLELSLNDLIRPQRKRKGIARDYEFIPRVRTVMIIDDGASGSDSDSDSGRGASGDDAEALDWEVVPEVGKRRTRHTSPEPPTYATVARTTK